MAGAATLRGVGHFHGSERDPQRPGAAVPDQDGCGRIAPPGWIEETCMSAVDVQPFQLAVPEAMLDDLRERLDRTRFPGALRGGG